MGDAWDTGLDADVHARLVRLNPPQYLAQRTTWLAESRALAADLPRRWDVVEIGSNRGTFCLGLAEARPDASILALEWREKWVVRMQAAVAERGLANLHCVRADARIALPLLAPAGSIDALFVFYPDPWWKQRHEHRRLLDGPFFEVAAELLASGGLLGVKTDVMRVYDAVRDQAAPIGALRPLPPREWPDERDWVDTTRERTVARAGIATYRLYWRRH